jgi:O-antigen/teichoic acid export membrane protein
VNTEALKEVLKFGLPFLPAALFSMVMELSDRYLLEWLADTASVGLYNAGNNFGKFGLLIVVGFNMGWTPYFLKIGKEEGAKVLFAKISKYFLGIMGFFIVLITIWIDSFVRLRIGGVSFFGEEYWVSTQVVPILLLGYYFFGFYILQLPGVFHTDRTKLVPLFRGIGAGLIIVLNIFLIPVLGIMGAAYSKAFAYIGMGLAILISNHKHYKIPHYWSGILFPMFYMIIIIVTPMTMSLKIISSLFYIITWFIFVANNDDRKKVSNILK